MEGIILFFIFIFILIFILITWRVVVWVGLIAGITLNLFGVGYGVVESGHERGSSHTSSERVINFYFTLISRTIFS